MILQEVGLFTGSNRRLIEPVMARLPYGFKYQTQVEEIQA
jgi:hypothetical protein